MARLALSLVAGLVFGLGLIIAGMTDPAKVLNFLDLFGTFDPSLIFVLGGAVVVSALGFRLAWRRQAPLLAPRFELPATTGLDARLIAGAAIFGIGWGLSGYCPGPALTALPQAAGGTLVFVSAMLAGMWLARLDTSGSLSLRQRGKPEPPFGQPERLRRP